jgi:hypothetical protein
VYWLFTKLLAVVLVVLVLPRLLARLKGPAGA